jgi:hypothetical protein
VQNVKEARTYLEQGGIYLDNRLNTDKLVEAMLRASTDISVRATAYLRAFSLILESYKEDKLVATVEDQMGNQMSEVSRLLMVFESHSTALSVGVDKLRQHTDRLESTDGYIREAAKDVLDEFTLQTKNIGQHQSTGDNATVTPALGTGNSAPQSYPAAAQQGGTTQKPRQSMLHMNQGRNRRIIIDAKGDDISQLTEETLVAKANMAIELMKAEDHPNKPENIKFVSAKKLQNGGLEFELNSNEVATWIKGDNIRKKLADNFGNSAEIRIHGYTILIKNALLYF